MGLEDKPSKRSAPATELDILGFRVDTVAETVSVIAERCAALVAEIDEFLADSADSVGRREIAGLIGRLQWIAQIATGGQLHLRQCYRARDAFTQPPGATLRQQ